MVGNGVVGNSVVGGMVDHRGGVVHSVVGNRGGVDSSMVGHRGSVDSMASMSAESCEGGKLGVSVGVACHHGDKGHKTEGL